MCVSVEKSSFLKTPGLDIDAKERDKTVVLQITFGLESCTEGILLIHYKSLFCSLNTFITFIVLKKRISGFARLSMYLRKTCSMRDEAPT